MTSYESYNSCMFTAITFLLLFDGLIIQFVEGISYRNSQDHMCWTIVIACS